MVTIPVSMYQTVVTNLNLQGDLTQISTIGANQLGEAGGGGGGGGNEVDAVDVKSVLNGNGPTTIRIVGNSTETS